MAKEKKYFKNETEEFRREFLKLVQDSVAEVDMRQPVDLSEYEKVKKQFGYQETEDEESAPDLGGKRVLMAKSFEICGTGALRALNQKRREWQEQPDTWNMQQNWQEDSSMEQLV